MTDRLKLLSALVSEDDSDATSSLSVVEVAVMLERVRDEQRSTLLAAAR